MQLVGRELWEMRQRLEYHTTLTAINEALVALYSDIVETGDISSEQAEELIQYAEQAKVAAAKLKGDER